MNDKSRDSILLDCYRGAYGMTIRIDIMSLVNLFKIKELFISLSGSGNVVIALHEVEDVVTIGSHKVILKSAPNSQRIMKELRRVQNEEDSQVVYFWEMSLERWSHVVCLTQSLIDNNRPGHQYLIESGSDNDAIIELAFMERYISA